MNWKPHLLGVGVTPGDGYALGGRLAAAVVARGAHGVVERLLALLQLTDHRGLGAQAQHGQPASLSLAWG